MSSRDQILQSIRASKPMISGISLPKINAIEYADKTVQFISVLESIGGKVLLVNNESEVYCYVSNKIKEHQNFIIIKEGAQIDLSKQELYDVDIACICGGVAVAENATIWIPEKSMGNRMLPFSCQQLMVIIQEKNIVHNMHQAYDLIDIAAEGYGVFIAGPSKTADIEQSLVIGAHGPVEYWVFIIKE